MSDETPSLRDEAVAPAGLMILVAIIVATGCVWLDIAQGNATPESLAKAAGSAWLGLSIVLPLGLASYLWLDFQHTEVPEFYRNQRSAMTICVGGGGGGGLGANIFFLLVTVFLPSILSDEAPMDVQNVVDIRWLDTGIHSALVESDRRLHDGQKLRPARCIPTECSWF